jgi:ATP-dependent 26S proteasome regulatory subunit
VINFPFPDEHNRLRIWNNIFPDTLPLTSQLNLSFIARNFELSGGNIRNVALAAAFLAAKDGRVVKKTHLVHAIKREYQKIGRLISPKEFEAYLNAKN